MTSKTSIAISKLTKEQLSAFGKKGQTFDQIISELIKKWNEEN